MAPASEEFRAVQAQFAAHMRDPAQNQPPPGIEARRLKVYADLIYNNIEKFLANGFPIFRSLAADSAWHVMVRDFVREHESHSPYFLEIGQEFMRWLDAEVEAGRTRAWWPGFLQELCHYEWVELALDVSPSTTPVFEVRRHGDLLEEHPVVSPLAWSLVYQWPVHLIGPAFQPEQPPDTPTCLIVFRDAADEVRFIESNPVTARLLSLLHDDEKLTGRGALRQVAAELNREDDDAIIGFGLEILSRLRDQGVIAGTRIVPAA